MPPATYVVNLKFAELYYRSRDQRRFNVNINATRVLQDFDIVAAAGGAFTAIDRAFQVPAPAGQIVIQFATGAADIPAVNAIEILRLGPSLGGGTLQVSPPSVTLLASQSQTFTATATDLDPAVTWTVSPPGTGVLASSGNSATYTAPAQSPGEQTVTVTATSVANGSIAASATVTLSSTIASSDGTLVPPATRIVDASSAVWTMNGAAVLRNGVSAGGGTGVQMLWSGGSIYVLSGLGGSWWRWTGSGLDQCRAHAARWHGDAAASTTAAAVGHRVSGWDRRAAGGANRRRAGRRLDDERCCDSSQRRVCRGRLGRQDALVGRARSTSWGRWAAAGGGGPGPAGPTSARPSRAER